LLDNAVLGEFVRIRRAVETPDPGDTGSALDDHRVLTLADVDVYNVPEPGTIVLMAMAAVTLVGIKLRRKIR